MLQITHTLNDEKARDAFDPAIPSAWYALRRTLPPWRFDELLDEMIRELPAQGVNEVIVMVDTEEFSHGFPSLDWIRKYRPMLERAREALHGAGIVYSLNPWVTIGHMSRSRRMLEAHPAIDPVVNADGIAESSIACPLSAGWRAYMAAAWTLYAETKASVIWIEDDIRTFGHHFCLCPLHLARFSAQVGRPVTREELHDALIHPGEPHPWRTEFLRMQDEITREAAGHLGAIVRATSPETRMGLMSSGPRNHVQEGRHWRQFASAIEPAPHRLLSRPTMGNYWEWDLRGMYFAQDSIKITRHALPDGVPDITEVEAMPFSRTSNSVAFLAAKLWISFAYGARGTTLNIFDHLGSPMSDVPQFGRVLAALKPRLNALAGETRRPGEYRGVRLFHFDNAAFTARLDEGAVLADLRGEGLGAMHAFEAAGIPTTYTESEVAALIGQQVRLLDDDELRNLLTRGLFLDGPAARILCERGFGPLIGLETTEALLPLPKHGAVSAEELLHPDFDGAPQRYLTAFLPNANYEARLCRLHPSPGTLTVSRIVNPDTEPLWPLMTAFENNLGGRVIVHGWDYESSIGAAFYGVYRTRQMQAAARWLFRGRAPLVASSDGVWPLAFRKDCGEHTITGLFQLSLDPWHEGALTLHGERTPDRVERLDALGNWSRAGITFAREEQSLTIRFDGPITYGEPAVARIIWTDGKTGEVS